MTKEELMNVKGGIAFTSAVLSALTKAVTTIYDIAKRFGTAVYRTRSGSYCNN